MNYKLIIFILIAVICAGLVLTGYINDYFVPHALKTRMILELENRLRKSIQINNLRYSPLKGLILSNLVITDRSQGFYLEAKQVLFKFLILPLFKTEIIIPNIYFEDERAGADSGREINNIKIALSWNLAKKIKFNMHANIPGSSKEPSFVSAAGKLDYPRRGLQAKIKLEHLVIIDYLPYFKNIPVKAYDGILNADLDIKLKNKKLEIKGAAYVKNIELRRSRFAFTGDIDIVPDIRYNFQNKKLEYGGRLGVSNAVFSGPKSLKDISGIRGNIHLERNKIWSYGIKANVLDTPISIKGEVDYDPNQLYWDHIIVSYKDKLYRLSGNITDFKQPKINLTLYAKDVVLKTNFDIKDKIITINSCTGKYLDNDISLKGTADIKNRSVDLKTVSNLSLKEIIEFLPVKIGSKIKKIQAGKDISGKLNMALDLRADIRNFLGSLRGKGYASLTGLNLWDLSVFKKVRELLFLPMKNIIFEEVHTNFIIRDKNMHIVKSSTKSKQLTFYARGNIAFNGIMDVTLDAKINKDVMNKLVELTSVSIAEDMEDLLTVQINGSLVNPQLKVTSSNQEAFKLIKEIFQSFTTEETVDRSKELPPSN